MLPPNHFVGGWQWDNGRNYNSLINDDYWLIHSSWTDDHSFKIKKFALLNSWFYNEKCTYFKKELLPNNVTLDIIHSYKPISVEEKKYIWPEKEPHEWW